MSMNATELVKKRKAAGLTQAQLAEALGVHQVTVARYETGVWPITSWMDLAIMSVVDKIKRRQQVARKAKRQRKERAKRKRA